MSSFDVVRRQVRGRGPLFALLGANAISDTGTAITMVAVPWFVLQTTGSAARTGLAMFVATLPILISGTFAGALIDRIGYRRVSVLADIGSGLLVAVVPVLHMTVGLVFWQLLALLFARWLLAAPGDTARQALVPEVAAATETSLERATSAYETIDRLAKMAGPGLAGVLIFLVGAADVLLIDAASFLISAATVGVGLVRVRVPEPDAERAYLRQLRDGLAYLRRDTLLRAVVLMVLVTNLLDASWTQVLVPVYAERILESPVAFGAILATMSAGAVVGTIVFGAVGKRLPRRATFTVAFLIIGAPRFAIFLIDPGLAPILITMAGCGFAAGAINPLVGTVAYERIPEQMRARVLGLITAGAFAAYPLGGLVGGFTVEGLGLKLTFLLFGALYLAVTLAPAIVPAWRQLDARISVPTQVAFVDQHTIEKKDLAFYLVGGEGEGDRARVAVLVDGADAEEVVVFGEPFHGELGAISCPRRVGPHRRGGVSPHDLVTGKVGFGVGIPCQCGVVRELFYEDPWVVWGGWGARDRGDCGGVELGHPCQVIEVDELDQVAVDSAVFDAHVLVLVGVLLAGFGESYGGIAVREEGELVAAAQEPVGAVDHPRVELRCVRVRGRVDVAGQLPRHRIVLPADRAADLVFLSGLWRHTLGKYPDSPRVACAIPHHIVVEHSLDVHAVPVGLFGEVCRAIQALFFPGDGHKDDAGIKGLGRHHSRQLEHCGDPGGIIIGAWSEAVRIGGVAAA